MLDVQKLQNNLLDYRYEILRTEDHSGPRDSMGHILKASNTPQYQLVLDLGSHNFLSYFEPLIIQSRAAFVQLKVRNACTTMTM